MKVFISWSGETSHGAALALREWIPVVLPYAKTWVSSEDIAKGSRWGAELATELDTTNCGIVCLTVKNVQEPWLNFEAGALSKAVNKSQVHPLLLGMRSDELEGPLSQFQATEFKEGDVKKLVSAINNGAGSLALTGGQLDRNFRTCWSTLEETMRPVIEAASSESAPPHVADEPLEVSEGSALDSEELEVLRIMAEARGERVFPEQLARQLGIHGERAKHLMEKLQESAMLDAAYNYVDGTSWLLSAKGRAELVRRKLL